MKLRQDRWQGRWTAPRQKLAAVGLSASIGWMAILMTLAPSWAQSGGRARGGSFSQPSQPAPPSRSAPSGGSGGGGYSAPYDYSVPRNRDYSPGSYRRPTVIVAPPQSYPIDPYGGYGSSYGTSSGGDGLFLILVLVGGMILMPIAMSYMRQMGGRSGSPGSASEQANDIVTVTQLQVALLAQARYIQDSLTQLSAQANLESQAGLNQLLQETVLALLRSPENWSHAKVNSQTVRSRAQASQLFEQLSIQERSKLTSETLVNIDGQVRRQAVKVSAEADPASYIVVTLLVGTADDKPLIKPDSLHSAEELTAILKRLGSITPSYLMIYELIWTPQDATDSLSREQLLTHYPDLIQIA
ncbi:MAG: DUF1517 domain-containing protein [Pegethrix bostrychoides GSE-TBD4-15B]|uniref:DUF1517 domain-containing protein n=1 Tax=Pegethrix bostrychoides GSE-TBD4-15B TaxID=2839662 RepID=A0A951P8H8_9CYAN|nr:DUF1517 domain-containing protein [Pegethrix bostrychoides GSE-TBD4-15B]